MSSSYLRKRIANDDFQQDLFSRNILFGATYCKTVQRNLPKYQAMSKKYVYQWFTSFRKGRESVSHNTHRGEPATSVSDENIEKVRKLITKDFRLTVCMIAAELPINRESVRHIVTQNFRMRKTCYCLVPHHLTDD
ncbi:HTH_48 domain-containing protein [Trichonephila clavipes]|nr:HTH_48 domain-containing protein [Trichonephila clavipes]